MERLVQLWELVYECQQQWRFLRMWRAELEHYDVLLAAASKEPTMILPDPTYTFMVNKDIFRAHRQGDMPLRWLDQLSDRIKHYYTGSLKKVKDECAGWKLTLAYVDSLADTLREQLL